MVKCCATSCGIAATLIAGMAYCTYMGNRTKLVQDYMHTLSADQRQIYAKIVEERRGIYLRGFGLGLFLSALLLGIHHQYLTMSRAVLLSPKSDWMVLHFENKSDSANHSTNNHSDAANWLRVYRGMQVNYHVGLVLGIAGTVLLSNAFYSKNWIKPNQQTIQPTNNPTNKQSNQQAKPTNKPMNNNDTSYYYYNDVKFTGSAIESPSDVVTTLLYIALLIMLAMGEINPNHE